MQQIATGLKEHSLVKVQLILFQLCCFFLPKVYAVVCKPDKRQRKPQTSRARKYETPPHSVAVGFADGALLGDVTRYNIQSIFNLSSAALSTDLSYPQMTNIQSFSEFVNVSVLIHAVFRMFQRFCEWQKNYALAQFCLFDATLVTLAAIEFGNRS